MLKRFVYYEVVTGYVIRLNVERPEIVVGYKVTFCCCTLMPLNQEPIARGKADLLSTPAQRRSYDSTCIPAHPNQKNFLRVIWQHLCDQNIFK